MRHVALENTKPKLAIGLRERLSEIEIPSFAELPGKRVILVAILALAIWMAVPRLRPVGEQGVAMVPPAARERVSEASSDVSAVVRRTTKRVQAAVVEAVQPVAASEDNEAAATKGKKSTASKSGAQAKQGRQTSKASAKQSGTKPQARAIIGEKQVVEGDTMRKIADRYYGNEIMWPLVWDYNKKRAKEQGQEMKNPDLIYPGWQFLIPKNEKE